MDVAAKKLQSLKQSLHPFTRLDKLILRFLEKQVLGHHEASRFLAQLLLPWNHEKESRAIGTGKRLSLLC